VARASVEHSPVSSALRGRSGVAGVLAVALVMGLTVFGWWRFWFLTDDAFITFRYVSNSMEGLGLVWNPPPFAPVEGYTSLLWALLLKLCWSVFGVEPPAGANWMSLVAGVATVGLVFGAVQRMSLPETLARHRTAVFLAVGLGILSNRSFSTWLSGGLETALFNLLLLAWVLAALAAAPGAGWWRRHAAVVTLAALLCLTRPDGLLYLGATVVLGVVQWARCPRPRRAVALLLAHLPVVVVVAHLLWRHATYGEWLPNTWRAKVGEPWPEAGLRYLASYVVEVGLWAWGLLVLAAAAVRRPGPAALWRHSARVLVTAAVLGHVGYYVFVVGGDHFEYRVLSHTIPLVWLSTAWLLGTLRLRVLPAAAAWACLVSVSLPVQWVHLAATADRVTRRDTFMLAVPIADRFPGPLRPLVARWDGWQQWLITHHVGMRHREHQVFALHVLAESPSRIDGGAIAADGHPVLKAGSVGILGWVLPHVAIIDRLGLNDRVVAATPLDHGPDQLRLMAHDRQPPPGYIACFRPNVQLLSRMTVDTSVFDADAIAALPAPLAVVHPRSEPLRDADIVACEERFSAGAR